MQLFYNRVTFASTGNHTQINKKPSVRNELPPLESLATKGSQTPELYRLLSKFLVTLYNMKLIPYY